MYTIIGGDGREYGPVSAEQVRQWIAAGRASLETQAKAAGSAEWKPVSEYPDIVSPGGVEPPPLQAVDRPLASLGARLAGFLVDKILQSICLVPLVAAVGMNALLAAVQARDFNAFIGVPRIMVGISITGLLYGAYWITQIVLLALRGQTLGKLLVGIRIVRYPDAAPAGLARAWLLRYFVMGLFYLVPIPLFGMVFWFVDTGFIFRPDRRCVHDHLAGTMVIAA